MRGHAALVWLCLGWAGSACAGQDAAPPTPSPAPPVTTAVVDEPGDGQFADADAMLTVLETGDAGLTALTAPMRYIKTFGLAGDTHTRTGRLYFSAEPGEGGAPPRRTFAVWFRSLQIGDALHEQVEAHIFDGRWYVERHEKDKRFIKREVVRPGERVDPLRLGEGPFPIPLGQKKEDILARFDATLVPALDGLDAENNPDLEESALADLRAFAEGAHQLRLVPREGAEEAAEFEEIRLWYRRGADGRLLPRLARTVNRAGDTSYVQLVDVRTNAEAAFEPEKTSTETPAEGGWDARVEPWDGDAR